MGILHQKQATLCDKSNNKTMSTTAGFKRYTVAGEAWRGVVPCIIAGKGWGTLSRNLGYWQIIAECWENRM